MRAMSSVSPVPTAAAIWRTPLWLTPRPATFWARVTIAVYSPMSPMPEGPRMSAMAFTRTMPSARLSAEEPPMSTDDFRIWP